MGAPTREGAALRLEVEKAILAKAEKAPAVGGIDVAGIVRQFTGRDVADSTLFRWCREIIRSGKPGQHAARLVKESATDRAARAAADPVAAEAEMRAELAERLPAIIRPEEILGAAAGGRVVGVIERLQAVMTDIEMLIAHAKAPDGKVRNARLLGTSLEQMRRCLETGVKLHQAMREAAATDALQKAVLDEIEKCSPDLAERVFRRIDALAASWMG